MIYHGCKVPVKVLTACLELRSQTAIRRAMKLDTKDKVSRCLIEQGVTLADTEDGLTQKFVLSYLETLASHPSDRWRNDRASVLLNSIQREGFDSWTTAVSKAYELSVKGETRSNRTNTDEINDLKLAIDNMRETINSNALEIERLKFSQIEGVTNISNGKNHIPKSNTKSLESRESKVNSDNGIQVMIDNIIYISKFSPPNIAPVLTAIARNLIGKSIKKSDFKNQNIREELDDQGATNFLLSTLSMDATDLQNQLLNDNTEEQSTFLALLADNILIKTDPLNATGYRLGQPTGARKISDLTEKEQKRLIDPKEKSSFVAHPFIVR